MLFKEAMEAHDVLSDSENRREYDRKRTRGRQPSARQTSNPRGLHWLRAFDNLSRDWGRSHRTMAEDIHSKPGKSLDVEAEFAARRRPVAGGPIEVRISVRNAVALSARGKRTLEADCARPARESEPSGSLGSCNCGSHRGSTMERCFASPAKVTRLIHMDCGAISILWFACGPAGKEPFFPSHCRFA